jgi:hypothetical protein
MQSKKLQKKTGREKLQRAIEICSSVEERSIDPFLIDVDEVIELIRQYFPEWKIPEDLCLDAETIHHLASVIRLQSQWIKHRSTSLYTDPFLLEEKLTRMDRKEIVEIFLKAWHPIVEMEQISLHSLSEAVKYWKALLPLSERWKEIPPTKVEAGITTRDELIKQRILLDKVFSEELENFWYELKRKVEEKDQKRKMRYWDFIGADTYEETVHRAFMTSFLVTYGYATLKIYPLEEEIFITPYEKPVTKTGNKQLVSIPLAITAEEWMRWKNGGPR